MPNNNFFYIYQDKFDTFANKLPLKRDPKSALTQRQADFNIDLWHMRQYFVTLKNDPSEENYNCFLVSIIAFYTHLFNYYNEPQYADDLEKLINEFIDHLTKEFPKTRAKKVWRAEYKKIHQNRSLSNTNLSSQTQLLKPAQFDDSDRAWHDAINSDINLSEHGQNTPENEREETLSSNTNSNNSIPFFKPTHPNNMYHGQHIAIDTSLNLSEHGQNIPEDEDEDEDNQYGYG